MIFSKKMLAITIYLSAFLMSFCLWPVPSDAVLAAGRLQKTGEKTVIVIDPGHGGSNLGTQTGGIWEEKYMTLVTARALYDELRLYDNVEVYLTRTEDAELTFVERAEFAAGVGADFLFSVHYNASEKHSLFGSEVWVPLAAPYNNYGYQVGCELLAGMKERGLFIRGIKTRKGDRGDYYAIIREPMALGIPAAIIEHCHVDEKRDSEYCDSEEDLIRFGKDDATAIAKYFGLKSSALRVDYSDYQLVETDGSAPMASTLQDETPPDICRIDFVGADYEKGELTLAVSAADDDSPLLYYAYSIDGGKTFSKKQPWPGCDTISGKYDDTFTLTIPIPSGVKPSVVLRAYNMFDPYTDSNLYESGKTFAGSGEAAERVERKAADEEESGAGALQSEADKAQDVRDGAEKSQGSADGAQGSAGEEQDSAEKSQSGPEDTAAAQESADSALPSDVPAMADGAVAQKSTLGPVTILEIGLVAAVIVLTLVIVLRYIAYRDRRKRRMQGMQGSDGDEL